MRRYNDYTQPGGSQRYTRLYSAMRGVDFTNDPLNCDPTRMPMAKNIIVDTRGIVHKRPGFKPTSYYIEVEDEPVEAEQSAAPPTRDVEPDEHLAHEMFPVVHGMWVFKPTKQKPMIIIHAGNDLYFREENGEVFWHIKGPDNGNWGYMNHAPSAGFQHKDRFYIMDGLNFFNYWFNDADNQWCLEPVYISATIPETQIAGYYFAEDYTDENDEPAVRYTWNFGEEGEKNLLTTRRINTFCGDAVHKNFYLDGQNLKVLKVEQYSPTTPVPSSGGGGTFTNGSAQSNVRDKPSQQNGAIIGHASAGQVFQVLGKSGNWYKIQYTSSVVGYIHQSRGTYHDSQGGTTDITPDTDWVTLTEGQNNDYTVEEVGSGGEAPGTDSNVKVYNCTKVKFKNAPSAHPRGNGLPNIRVTCVPKESAELTLSGTDFEVEDSDKIYWFEVIKMPLSADVTVKKNGTAVSSSNYNTTLYPYHEHFILRIAFASSYISDTDEIAIVYTRESMDGLDTVSACDKYGRYGEYNFDRYFYTGNTAHINRDWYSEPSDPTYVMENSYTDIGDAATPIAGYLNMQSDMLVIKEQSPFETLFRRTAQNDGDIPIFPVKYYQGKGATSRYALSNMGGACLYWTEDGLYEFISSDLGTKYSTQERSWLVNDYIKQAEGEDIVNARLIEYKDWLLIAFPEGRVYVADTTQQTAPSGNGTSGYEFFYWEGITMDMFVEFDGVFYFTTPEADGTVLNEFQFDDYADHYYDGSSAPIDCAMATFCDQMDEPSRYKYIERRGAIAHFQPMMQTLEMNIVTDSENLPIKRDLTIEPNNLNYPDLEHINASRPSVPYIAINQRINRFRYIQFIFRNNDPNTDAFGLLSLEYQYRFGRNVI